MHLRKMSLPKEFERLKRKSSRGEEIGTANGIAALRTKYLS